MKHRSSSVFVVMCWSLVSAVPAADRQFLLVHNQADPRFLTSIERAGPCKVTKPPEKGGIRVPYQLYPKESVDKNEEGTVQMEFILDTDWCVRKATIVQSTGYWRLDNVTLAYVMTVKYMAKAGSDQTKRRGTDCHY